jgi:hypothetical protein
MHLFLGSWNFTHTSGLAAAANEFIADRSLVWNWLSTHWGHFVSWIEQPCKTSFITCHIELSSDIADVVAIILAWWITFTVVVTLLLTLGGFGPAGIIAGMFALISCLRIWLSFRLKLRLGNLDAYRLQGL